MPAQLIERRSVLLMRYGKGVVHAAMILRARIDRRIALHEDQTGAGRVEKRHRALRHGREMPAADDLGVEARAALDIADRNAEMYDRLNGGHPPLTRNRRWRKRPLLGPSIAALT